MSGQATLIRTAVVQLLEGSIGSVRTLPPGLFGFGVFEGQPIAAQQARAIDPNYRHQFDVVVSTARPHRATPQSTKASYRIEARAVQVRIVTALSATSDQVARLEQRESIEQAASDAIGALAYPNNLSAIQNGEATGIVSGMLCGAEDGTGSPRFEIVSEDWRRQLLTSRIQGIAIVNVAQAVS